MHALEAILDVLDDPAAVGADDRAIRAGLSRPSSVSGSILRPARRPARSDDLIYVSPRSGRAVSRAAGEAYRDKLMRLPRFPAATTIEPPSAADVADAFALTGFFLERHAFAPRGLALPDARARFVAAVLVRAG